MKENNLVELLKGVSNSGTPAPADTREQIEYIDIGLIESDPGNFYKLTQLEELASNIAVVGLQQPLRVRALEESPEKVVVVSGHRRLAALKLLIKEGRKDLREVPCIREQVAGSAALQELRLIYANRDTRVISSGELAKQAERVELLLYQLKEEGFEFPGRMRDHIAQACKISAPKLARLKVIREKLIPEYMSLFEKDKLPEQTAYALARLLEDFQHRMFTALQATIPSGATVEKVLGKYNEGWRWEPQLTCPDGKACKRGMCFCGGTARPLGEAFAAEIPAAWNAPRQQPAIHPVSGCAARPKRSGKRPATRKKRRSTSASRSRAGNIRRRPRAMPSGCCGPSMPPGCRMTPKSAGGTTVIFRCQPSDSGALENLMTQPNGMRFSCNRVSVTLNICQRSPNC